MRLYVTPGSPYARMARIVVIEKGLAQRVQIITALTRQADSPYYRTNPSGRVPYLVRDDDVGMEGSAVICAYLDRVSGEPLLEVPDTFGAWEARRLNASARSLLDGLAVWSRETRRPASEQSATVIAHEMARAARMLDLWEGWAAHPLLVARLNMLQITLACALGLESRLPALQWRETRPALAQWYAAVSQRPSFVATAPPESIA